MIDVTDKSLTLSQRIEVASAFKAGFELDAEDVRFIHKSLTELRKNVVISVSAEEVYYKKKLQSLQEKHKARLNVLQGVLAINAIAAITGVIAWLT